VRILIGFAPKIELPFIEVSNLTKANPWFLGESLQIGSTIRLIIPNWLNKMNISSG